MLSYGICYAFSGHFVLSDILTMFNLHFEVSHIVSNGFLDPKNVKLYNYIASFGHRLADIWFVICILAAILFSAIF